MSFFSVFFFVCSFFSVSLFLFLPLSLFLVLFVSVLVRARGQAGAGADECDAAGGARLRGVALL
eukprot:3128975-Rhodomonas_salina.1